MKRLVVIAIALIAIDSTDAQPLVDPMRPPAGMLATSTGAGTTSALATAAPARPIVQTIIIGLDRRYAVIDGWMRPGDGFQYTSGAVLETSVGTMRGSYQMLAEDGTQFDAQIAEFTLSIPRTLH